MSVWRSATLALALCGAEVAWADKVSTGGEGTDASSTAIATFETTVVPLLATRCVVCHNEADAKGGLSLQTRSRALGASDSGRAIVAGDPDASLLLEYVSGSQPEMPKLDIPLSETEVAALRTWIGGGAPWPESIRIEARDNWWSRRPLVRPPTPEVPADQRRLIQTPIDAFVIAALREHGLKLSPETDARTLARRLYFDLIGLPPTPEEIKAFEAQVAAWRERNQDEPSDGLPQQAIVELVDQLLASPHYGERWARHWLDVVKYADTCGYDKDKLRPNAWPYRDYVIRSFNVDKPYARFVEEQIAGDVLYPGEPDGILGLGFIAAGPWDFIGHVEVPESKYDGKVARHLDRDDMATSAINAFCSVTIQCARCHDHKFDPFTQEHYYALQAVFAAVDRADRPYSVDPTTEGRRAELVAEIDRLTTQIKSLETDQSGSVASHRDATPHAVEQQLQSAQRELEALPKTPMVYAAATHFAPQGSFQPTTGAPRAIHVLRRGNVLDPGAAAQPGALPLPNRPTFAFQLSASHTEGERRAALARWIVDREHPLTWRSIVNRVWLYHFGQALVGSPNDFGRMGQRPTHPALLDWLAVEFRDRGGTFKDLHRLLVCSRTYRQSSAYDEASAAKDGGNQYLWRMNRRRLEAEEIRDSILAVSGRLDQTMGGPGFYLFELERDEHSPHYEYRKFDPTDARSHRRTVYRFIVRSQPDPLMTTLDCADSSQSTPQRDETLNALQALSMLNSRFNLVMAQFFAERTVRERADLDQQIARAWELAIGRPPQASEQDQLRAYAVEHGMANLCRALFNLSEFVYLD